MTDKKEIVQENAPPTLSIDDLVNGFCNDNISEGVVALFYSLFEELSKQHPYGFIVEKDN